MQIINYYKDIVQENVKLIVSFLKSTENENITIVGKQYEKSKKRPRYS